MAPVGWNSADPAEAPRVFDLAKNGRSAELGNSNHLDVSRSQAGLWTKPPVKESCFGVVTEQFAHPPPHSWNSMTSTAFLISPHVNLEYRGAIPEG